MFELYRFSIQLHRLRKAAGGVERTVRVARELFADCRKGDSE